MRGCGRRSIPVAALCRADREGEITEEPEGARERYAERERCREGDGVKDSQTLTGAQLSGIPVDVTIPRITGRAPSLPRKHTHTHTLCTQTIRTFRHKHAHMHTYIPQPLSPIAALQCNKSPAHWGSRDHAHTAKHTPRLRIRTLCQTAACARSYRSQGR